MQSTNGIEEVAYDATPDDLVVVVNQLVAAVNALAQKGGEQAAELQGVREAVQSHGTAIGTFLERAERLLERLEAKVKE